MRFEELLKLTKDSPIIKPQDIGFLGKPSVLRAQLSRWKKEGKLLELRKGYYLISYPFSNIPPLFFIANQLLFPSYVSLQSALSYYGLIPEAVSNVITSVTPPENSQF